MRIALLIVALIASLFGCGAERYSWNERTTVTVQTPNGLVTGTSVIEFRAAWCEDGCGLPPMNYQWDYTGEAVVVEVLPERYLFVLPGTFLAHAHLYAPAVLGNYDNTGERLRNASALTEPIVLPLEAYPEMLTFLELGNRESLREVDPNDMNETFGAGVEIISITLEVTRDLVTQPRVADLLEWTCSASWPIRVPSDSPRGWENVGSFDFGRSLNFCH